MKIFIASDHAGVNVKSIIVKWLEEEGDDVVDLGPSTEERVDYPIFATHLAHQVREVPEGRGVLICGTGIGMSMVANKYQGIRASLCHSIEDAKMARLHNNANVLCLGARTTPIEDIMSFVKVWRGTEFSGGRHTQRLALFDVLGSRPILKVVR